MIIYFGPSLQCLANMKMFQKWPQLPYQCLQPCSVPIWTRVKTEGDQVKLAWLWRAGAGRDVDVLVLLVMTIIIIVAIPILAWLWPGSGSDVDVLLVMTIIIICCKTQVNWSGRKMMATLGPTQPPLGMKNDVETGTLCYCTRLIKLTLT